jgi:hypothetical protein
MIRDSSLFSSLPLDFKHTSLSERTPTRPPPLGKKKPVSFWIDQKRVCCFHSPRIFGRKIAAAPSPTAVDIS